MLDKGFENVCELDLIYNPDRLYYMLDEIVVDGFVTETNINDILANLKILNVIKT